MPREHKSRREVLDAIETLQLTADLLSMSDGQFQHELDVDVIVYGRNYSGKKVGPYLRLLTYEPGEVILTEGEWGGDAFYIVVKGQVDVLLESSADKQELGPGSQFGEMPVLAGVPCDATVKASSNKGAQVIEIQRPALRLLRKLKNFGDVLDKSYRRHGRDAILKYLKGKIKESPKLLDDLKKISLFRVYSKNHILFRQNATIDRIYIIKEGWLHRTQDPPSKPSEDFLGNGFCLGIEGIMEDAAWPYSATIVGRTEVLEISIVRLRQSIALKEALSRELARYRPPVLDKGVSPKPGVREKITSAQRSLIDTGLVDATNLLVMDMDLCVRCGNCSLACHKIHGQSRLTRRGIHVTRLEAPKPRAIQSILAPAVCLHCQAPECLTGCPTGAIGRFADGRIDINPQTCIGCGDCATQCPYNAISMVPRKGKEASVEVGFAARLRDLLKISSDPLPPSVDATEDLLAVKCNLCSDRTTLNPRGSKTQAFSCEENCPTGALARINPRQYFTEIGDIQGLLFLDETHATGRNIHKSDPPKSLIRAVCILLTAILTIVTIIGLREYGFGERIFGFLNMRWITGLVGLIGIAGGMAYPVRRQIYRRRAGSLRYWLLAHSYLGVIAGIMILLHGGTDSGGAFTTALMISFDLVILTGVFGIFCYLVVPRMLTRIEGSPLLVDDLKARREELKKEIAEIARTPSEPLRNLVKTRVVPRFVSFGYLLQQYVRRESLDRLLESAKGEFQDDAARLPDDKQRRLLMQVIDAAVTMRRVDALIYLHRLLNVWLPPHVASTYLMLALMVVHIIQVIYYASR